MGVIHNTSVQADWRHFYEQEGNFDWTGYHLAVENANAWCRQNCLGLFRQVGNSTTWEFASPQDATLFKLFWG